MNQQLGLIIRTIVDRLNNLLEQKKIQKEQSKKQWKRLQKENYSKSLDSRSFVFMKNEKKSLNSKFYIREIKNRWQF